MQTVIPQRYVKGSDFSKPFLKKLGNNFSLNQYFELMPVSLEEIEFDDGGKPMPPEKDFRPEFIAEVEARRKGKTISCNSREEREALFNKIWNEDE